MSIEGIDYSQIQCERCGKLGIVEEAMDVFCGCLCQACYEKLWAEYVAAMTAPEVQP